MGVNQKGPQGTSEDRVVQRGGFNTELGNRKARDVGGGGPGTGRDVHRSGGQGQYGSNPGNPPMRPRSDDVMDP
jgi:hypothetical protein